MKNKEVFDIINNEKNVIFDTYNKLNKLNNMIEEMESQHKTLIHTHKKKILSTTEKKEGGNTISIEVVYL